MIHGLIEALSPQFMLWLTVGVLAGMIVGALPGLTATMGVALLVPFTFDLPPGAGLAMLGALYVCAMFSDAVPAVLVNTPGTPAAMATAFDGYPMTLQGRAQEAIVGSCFSAALGAIFGAVAYLVLAWPLTTIALRFGPPEFFWIGVFALTIIGSLAGKSILKGIAGGSIGMLVSTIGISHTGAVSRFTFGIPDLRGGVSLVAALIGVFAVPQVLSMVCERRQKEFIAEYTSKPGVAMKTIWAVLMEPVHFIRSALIGTFVGILPGAGSPIAALIAYNEAVRWSKDKSQFGKGDLRGVTASEIANNACAPASMIPLVTLGVPGSAPAAVVAGALMLRGLNPGPDLFLSNGTLVYQFGWSLMLAGVVTFILGTIFSPWLARMVNIPLRLLAPLIMFLSVIGSYAIRNDAFDIYLMLALGLFTYIASKLDFHPGPIGLGLILGPIVEPALVQSMYLADATSYPKVFFGSTVDVVLILMTVLSLGWVLWSQLKQNRQPSLDTARAVTEDVA
ncbi:MAG TPA: tripartite tricarboxylate transporter permease [Pseudolabrys sp.]|nr:tripartite tricarboxylate transporter permease [Pseudolabrys sp.]